MQKRRMKATATFVLATAFSLFSGANLDAQSFTEEAMPLTTALDGAVPYLIGRIPAGAKVLVLNFAAESSALSNYLVDEITARLVNSNNFIVVDRRDLDVIRQEMKLYASGEVSNETATAIGKKIGADSIVFGSVERTGQPRLHISAVDVKTATIKAMWNHFIERDAIFAVLAGKGKRANLTGQPVGRVLQEASEYLIERVPANAKIAVFNMRAQSQALSTYINDGISESLVNSGKFTVVDRNNLDLLKAELDFQHSGETSEGTTVSIGKKIGAQSIITGVVEGFGELYRLQIRSIEVETAKIQAMHIYIIGESEILARLTEKEYKKLYLGAMPGFSIHLFNKGGGNFSIDGAFSAEFFINEMFSLQTGLFFTSDAMTVSGPKNVYDDAGNLKYSYDSTESFTTASLSFPLIAGINFYPSIFSLSVHGGLYVDVPINSVYKDSFFGTENGFERDVFFGYAVGGSAGVKLGPGILFFDMRYLGDFIPAKATIHNAPVELYTRHIIAFGIGYKIGFINQKK
jgi:curli biogenesis system outer membrane secretion channel CsgG